jgi:hypothetical protein
MELEQAAISGDLDYIKQHIPCQHQLLIIPSQNLQITNGLSIHNQSAHFCVPYAGTMSTNFTINYTHCPNTGDSVNFNLNGGVGYSLTNFSSSLTATVYTPLPPIGSDLLYLAARHSQMAVFAYLWDLGYRLSSSQASYAMLQCATYGHLDMLVHLAFLGHKLDNTSRYTAINKCIAGNHITVLDYFISLDNYVPGSNSTYLCYALSCNNLLVIKHLAKRGHVIGLSYATLAAGSGHEECIICLLEHNAIINFDSIYAQMSILKPSITSGSIKILTYMITNCEYIDDKCVVELCVRRMTIEKDDKYRKFLVWVLCGFIWKLKSSNNFNLTNFEKTILDDCQRQVAKLKVQHRRFGLKISVLKRILKPQSLSIQMVYF